MKYAAVASSYFKNLMLKILEFFETGKPDFDGVETLEVMKIVELLVKGKKEENKWLEV